MNLDYGQVRDQAHQAAYKHIRHLLRPDSVHLLGLVDLAEAIAVASDILAPAEHQALQQVPALQQALQRHRQLLDTVRGERDDALKAADWLAYSVAALTGEDIGAHGPSNNPWQRALNILDRIAEANGRPRPSDLKYGRVA